jgi:hypothetical protein
MYIFYKNKIKNNQDNGTSIILTRQGIQNFFNLPKIFGKNLT